MESLEILLNLIRSNRIYPNLFVQDIFDLTLKVNHPRMMDELFSILANRVQYQEVLKNSLQRIFNEMKSNEDAKNVRLFEKLHRLLAQSRSFIPSDDLYSILDRLIQSPCRSSISYSIFDTRYLLAMIILRSLNNFQRYSEFLQSTWSLILREINDEPHFKQIVTAYADRWNELMKNRTSLDDLNGLVRCLDQNYESFSKILQSVDIELFQQWFERILEVIVNARKTSLFFDFNVFVKFRKHRLNSSKMVSKVIDRVFNV